MSRGNWQDDFGVHRSTSLAQFSRVLDSVTADQGDYGPDPDLAALDELDGLEDSKAAVLNPYAIEWLGGAA